MRRIAICVIDKRKAVGSKCPDTTGHYNGGVRQTMNTFGAFKRKPNGDIDSFNEAVARPLRVAFRNASQN